MLRTSALFIAILLSAPSAFALPIVQQHSWPVNGHMQYNPSGYYHHQMYTAGGPGGGLSMAPQAAHQNNPNGHFQTDTAGGDLSAAPVHQGPFHKLKAGMSGAAQFVQEKAPAVQQTLSTASQVVPGLAPAVPMVDLAVQFASMAPSKPGMNMTSGI